MKILLINNDLPDMGSTKTLPLSMYFIGGLLRKYNHEIEIMDPMLYRTKIINQPFSEVLWDKAKKSDVVCFSVNSFTAGYMLKLSKLLYDKNYSGKVIWGGVHATHYPKELIENLGVDYAIYGEAEKTLPALINCIEYNKEVRIPNVYYKGSQTIKERTLLDLQNMRKRDFIFPAYDLVPNNIYDLLTIEASRGCFGNCTFCSVPNKNFWRPFAKSFILENIKKAIPVIEDKLLRRGIVFTDDCFTMDENRACELLDILYSYNLKDYEILIESRLSQMENENLINKLKEFKNIMIQIGIECGYDYGLKKIKKGINVDQITKVSEKLYKWKLSKNVFFSFIVGFPWETVEDCMKTLNFMSLIKNKYGIKVNCSWWLPVPSIDFEILKSMDNSINIDIFNEYRWIEKPQHFRKARPLLSELDIHLLNEKIYSEQLQLM